MYYLFAGVNIVSTPLVGTYKSSKSDIVPLYSTISPIYNLADEKSSTFTKTSSTNASDPNTTVINTATMVKKSAAKRDILANKMDLEKKLPVPLEKVKSPVKMLSAGKCREVNTLIVVDMPVFVINPKLRAKCM